MGDLDLTGLIDQWRAGDRSALGSVIEALYPELRSIAAARMRSESPGHTLQPTALVNEALLRFSGSSMPVADRVHLKAILATAMRRVLVDHARAKLSQKRGGGATVVTYLDQAGNTELPVSAMVELDRALERLAGFDERAERVVSLHYFGGLTYDEIAQTLEVSSATVHSDLRIARSWLMAQSQ